MVIGHVISERGEPESGESRCESPKSSDLSMYLEMGIGLAAVAGLLAMGAWVWYLANSDALSSIRRLQEML
jgi:hypothetical protein